MSREQRDRFIVRSIEGEVVGHFDARRQAIDRARQLARTSGHPAEVFDAGAQIGAPESWSVFPSGKIEALELRSCEPPREEMQR